MLKCYVPSDTWRRHKDRFSSGYTGDNISEAGTVGTGNLLARCNVKQFTAALAAGKRLVSELEQQLVVSCPLQRTFVRRMNTFPSMRKYDIMELQHVILSTIFRACP
jgi:hypothetical protein